MRAIGRLRGAQFAVMVCLLLFAACAPQASPSSGVGPASQAPEPQRASAPKVLTIGVLAEPAAFLGASGGPGGASANKFIAHDNIVVQADSGEFLPELAVEQISAANGTWVINADGSMDTTWKIRPNIKWHDGRPFSSDDILFSVMANNDKAVPSRKDVGVELIQSVDAPDPYTVHVHWSGIFAFANRAPGMTPMAKHIVEDAYQTNKQEFLNHPYFTTEFIGLGPYRLVSWERGSHLEFSRFDDYYRGQPPLDRVFVRFLSSGQGMVVAAMAGQVDAVVGSGMSLDSALEVRQRWEGTGNQVMVNLTGGVQQLIPQSRSEYAKPSALLNRSVRQAMMHAMDREELSKAVTLGLGPIAHAWYNNTDAIWPQIESAIPRYPYDPTRAQQLLTEAGWVRGADGVLVNQATGERFAQPLTAPPNQTGGDRLIAIVADYWKAVGVEPVMVTLSQAQYDDDELLAKHPAPKLSGSSAENAYLGNLNTKTIANASNRYRGKNQMGYSNPRFDAITDQLEVTIDPAQWVQLQRQALTEAMTDVAMMPLYWPPIATLMLKGVKAHPATYQRELWDFYYWDKE